MLFAASLGYLLASLVSGIAADRLGKKTILMFGFVLLIGATALFYVAKSFPVTVLLLLMISTGFGYVEVAVNSLGAQIFVTNAAVMMNMTHLFYGLGSSISPKYAGTMLARSLPWNYIYTITLAILIPDLSIWLFCVFQKRLKRRAIIKCLRLRCLRIKRYGLL